MRDLISIVALLALLRSPAAIASHGNREIVGRASWPPPTANSIFAAAAEGTGSSHDV
jgi:hypothetical protein